MSGIMNEEARWQKTTEKPRPQRKAENSFKPIAGFPGGQGKGEDGMIGKTDSPSSGWQF
jgi:hypothetical protein